MSSAGRSVLGIPVLALLACTLVPALAMAQQIVKWTDANGRVHYSDHAPPEQSTETVNIQKAPPPPPATAPKPRSATLPENIDGAELLMKQKAEFDASYKREAEQRKFQEADQKKKRDQAIVDRCNARREIYCDKGADGIGKEESMRAFKAEARQRSESMNPRTR